MEQEGVNYMREILFRAKAINRFEGSEYRTKYKNGDWVYGLIERLYNERFDLPATMINTNGVSDIDVDYKTIGQFTGLVDKNGVKIFEGDIVLKRTYQGKKPFPVAYHDGMFHCGWGGGSSTATHGYTLADKQIEVIGNVYDNSNLLEDKK